MDDSSLVPVLPPDFQCALKRSRLHEFFLKCAYVHRAGYLSWILAAVRPELRLKRIGQAIARLRAQRAEVLAAARGRRLAEIHRPALDLPAAADGMDRRRSA